MQLQLSLTLADDLHDLLLITGEPLDYLLAAQRLLALRAAPPVLCRRIMSTLVDDDRRFCWASPSTIGLADWRLADPDLSTVSFVVIDLETTGTRPGAGKITEIGAVRIEGLRQVATFETLVNPLRSIPPMVIQITGITPLMVRDAPRIEEVMPHLLDFVRGAVMVAHNAIFDLSFLNYELTRLRGRRLGDGAIDTVTMARCAAPGLPNYRLGTVAGALGSPVAPTHRALADAEATAHVFLHLVGRLQEQGITCLDQLRSHVDPSHRRDRHKVALTRDIPRRPGAYLFVDQDDNVIYVGKAEVLRDRVRSYFLARNDHSRKVRQAVRRLVRVDWEETGSPLAAVVREQQLILQHRPSGNVQGSRPESYVYLKVARQTGGLRLYASDRMGSHNGNAKQPLTLGPFRGRGRVKGAIDLLNRCYPLRRCSGRSTAGPCLYGQTAKCLAPCRGEQDVLREHDDLLAALVAWIAGEDPLPAGDDPLDRGRVLMTTLAAERRYEEAQEVRDALDGLAGVRRSYRALREACGLRLGVFTPASEALEPSIQLDLVWQGRLHASTVLTASTAALEIGRLIRSLPDDDTGFDESAAAGGAQGDSAGLPADLVAVPQQELDLLLAVRRWVAESPEAHIVPMTGAPGAPVTAESLEGWRVGLIRAALGRLS